MAGIDAQVLQIVLTAAIATGSAVVAAVGATNKIVRDSEHRFTVLEATATANKASIAEQWMKLDKIMDAITQIQHNCIAHGQWKDFKEK